MWSQVLKVQDERFKMFGGKRFPMTIVANRRTMNVLCTGIDDDKFPRFEKASFKTSFGDLYVYEHRSMDDGEMMFL